MLREKSFLLKIKLQVHNSSLEPNILTDFDDLEIFAVIFPTPLSAHIYLHTQKLSLSQPGDEINSLVADLRLSLVGPKKNWNKALITLEEEMYSRLMFMDFRNGRF